MEEFSNQDGRHEISLSSFKDGVYFIRILSDDDVEVHRIIKN
ncbi:T9SS type A sorting domain-containing protein [uncultured Dokdonia sp.]